MLYFFKVYGVKLQIQNIRKWNHTGDVYNLEVEDNHNYFVNNVLVSNCHGAKAVSVQDIAKKCINSDYRIGFTGTLPSEPIDKLTITGYLGPVYFEKKSDDLIKDGILSDITIACLLIKYPQNLINYKMIEEYQDEVNFVSTNQIRNRVFDYIFSKIPDGQNSLILVSLIEHLRLVESYLKTNLDKKYKIYIVYGGIKPEDREEIRTKIENEENVIIIATFGSYKQGINIKRLHNVIFGSSLKSEISVPQAIGRGLRTHGTKDKLILWDIIDNMSEKHIISRGPNKVKEVTKYNYMMQQFFERLKLYKAAKFNFFSRIIEL